MVNKGHSLLKCDCMGITSCLNLWANQHGCKERWFCEQCFAYTDVLYTHKAMGEMVTRTGMIKGHHRRTVDKEECYFCQHVRGAEKMTDHEILEITQNLSTHEPISNRVTVRICLDCHGGFKDVNNNFDDIPF